jgi:hypothetical protein
VGDHRISAGPTAISTGQINAWIRRGPSPARSLADCLSPWVDHGEVGVTSCRRRARAATHTCDAGSPTTGVAQWHAAGMPADGLTVALDDYQRAQELVEARNRLARAIAGAAMSGMTRDEIVDLMGYPADLVLRICRGAGISGE